MYPALVNCTTVIYFSEWPSEALVDVAHHFLKRSTFDVDNHEAVGNFCVKIDTCQLVLASPDIGSSLCFHT